MSALFFDIDGTILSEITGKVPKSTKEALEKAKEKGHHLFVNTGRTACDLSNGTAGLPFDGYCCGCGTRLIYRGETLLAHPIPKERGKELIDLMLDCRVEGQIEGTEDLYFQEKPYRSQEMEEIRKRALLRGLGRSSFLERKDFSYDKILIYLDGTEDGERFFREIEKDMETIDRRRGYYECIQKGYSKATAIAFFRDYLRLSMDQIYVFGDSSNDEAMFSYARHTIAMGKHDAMLDPMTEYVTDTVERDGIYKALEHYGLI